MTGRLRLDNADLALPALLAGAGLAKMPDFVVWRQLREGTLVELLPGVDGVLGPLNVVTPPGTLRPARVTALIDYVTQHFRHAPWIT